LCFFCGYKVGIKTTNKEEINLDGINPVKVINTINQTREEAKEQERMRIIAENIDNYDGTGLNQKNIPR
jgi:flagellar assembly factor FliW